MGDAFVVRRSIEEGRAQFGIAFDDGHFVGFVKHVLHNGHFVLSQARHVESSNHYLLGDKGLEVEIFLEWVKSKKPDELRRLFRTGAGARARALQNKGNAEQVKISRVQSWELVAHLASLGIGRGWHPDFLCQSRDLMRSAASEIPKVSCQVVLCYRNTRNLSSGALAFIEELSSGI